MIFVSLPDDTRVYIEPNEMKCDKVILSEKIPKKHFLSNLFEQKVISYDRMLELVEKNGIGIKYIDQKFKTKDMLTNMVKRNWEILKHIEQPFRTDEMMMEQLNKIEQLYFI
jgi:hypothetical protein